MPAKPADPLSSIEPYSPAEIAELVDSKGVSKVRAPLPDTLALGVLAGAFIALGGVFSTLIGTHSGLGFGPTRMLMGVGFSLGLILVVVAGAELFTGNNLVVMSWVSRRISLVELLKNWTVVYVGNFIGALSIVVMVYFARWWAQDDNGVGALALTIAAGKVNLSFEAAFVRGILANALVCLAVWLSFSGRSVIDKIFAIIFPVSAFVASSFEHSIANMYFIPLGLLLTNHEDVVRTSGLVTELISSLSIVGFLHNLAASTLGNIVGGGIFVGLVYWFIYLRNRREKE